MGVFTWNAGGSPAISHRDRRTIPAYVVLVDDQNVTCVVTERATDVIRRSVALHPKIETMGLVGGRIFNDKNGTYVVITSAVSARRLDASAGHVRCDDAEFARMRDELLRGDPACELIGWWHSHTIGAAFSATDREEQRAWTHPYSIGLLAVPADSDDDITLRAHRGPGAIPMLSESIASPAKDDKGRGRALPVHSVAFRPAANPHPGTDPGQGVAVERRPIRRRSRLGLRFAIVSSVIAVGLSIAALAVALHADRSAGLDVAPTIVTVPAPPAPAALGGDAPSMSPSPSPTSTLPPTRTTTTVSTRAVATTTAVLSTLPPPVVLSADMPKQTASGRATPSPLAEHTTRCNG
jgi:proteasome lid subunit RPN8/RPN11